MASFQYKIGWKRRRKRENKNCLSVPFLPDGKYKIPKKEKKIPLWLHFMPKQVGKCREREKIKIIIPFRSYITIKASFQDKIGWKTQRKRENKNSHYVPFRSYPKSNRKFQKNSKKIQKVKKKKKKPLWLHFKPKIGWKRRGKR